MKRAIKTSLSFGVTSGIITTLGLIVGLHSGTHSKLVVIGGIITIAIADSLSDALGIHVSKESENKYTEKELWESMLFTFIFKFVVALTFIIPALLLEISNAISISILWGMLLLSILSFYIAKSRKENPIKVIGEHLIVALIVITLAHIVGDWVSLTFI